MAALAAYNTFTNPGGAALTKDFGDRVKAFDQARDYYSGARFSRRFGKNWAADLEILQLYKHTRLIYNYVPTVVDFYVDNIWSAAADEDNPALVTPVAAGASDELIEAVAQIDQWTNWRAKQKKVKREAGVKGACLVEIIDDLERGKILDKIIKPEHVVSVEMNSSDDVVRYAIAYPAKDEKGEVYTYQKIVTKELFYYFRDDEPFVPPGKTAAIEQNPYGFCPAAYFVHDETEDGNPQGAFTDYDKLDNLNSLASHIDDFVHKAIESPKLIGSEDGKIEPVIGGTKDKDGNITTEDTRRAWAVFIAEGAVSVHDLLGNLPLGEAIQIVEMQIKSFEKVYPEIKYEEVISGASDASGIALERRLIPAQNKLDHAAANYDQQLIKLRQMMIAIAGWRTSNGWTNLTPAQRKFAAFNLDSYDKGELDFNLKRSLLIEMSEKERLELDGLKLDNANKAAGILPLEKRIALLGFDEKETRELMNKLANEEAPIMAGAAMFALGDRVKIKGAAHMPGQSSGTIALVNGNAYGIVFDGMESMGIHKWYVAEELESISEPADQTSGKTDQKEMTH